MQAPDASSIDPASAKRQDPSGTHARYAPIADFYEEFAPDAYDDPPTSALLSLVDAVSGLRLLDLACGHGKVARELARRDAQVVGVDISGALLNKARSREKAEPLGITYIQGDAAAPDTLQGELFNGVVCHFGLSDIDDLDGALATVARVVEVGGFFVFSILHPCFPGWEAKGANPSWPPGRGYFEEGGGLRMALRVGCGQEWARTTGCYLRT